jgi:hypothetical protein
MSICHLTDKDLCSEMVAGASSHSRRGDRDYRRAYARKTKLRIWQLANFVSDTNIVVPIDLSEEN